MVANNIGFYSSENVEGDYGKKYMAVVFDILEGMKPVKINVDDVEGFEADLANRCEEVEVVPVVVTLEEMAEDIIARGEDKVKIDYLSKMTGNSCLVIKQCQEKNLPLRAVQYITKNVLGALLVEVFFEKGMRVEAYEVDEFGGAKENGFSKENGGAKEHGGAKVGRLCLLNISNDAEGKLSGRSAVKVERESGGRGAVKAGRESHPAVLTLLPDISVVENNVAIPDLKDKVVENNVAIPVPEDEVMVFFDDSEFTELDEIWFSTAVEVERAMAEEALHEFQQLDSLYSDKEIAVFRKLEKFPLARGYNFAENIVEKLRKKMVDLGFIMTINQG